MQTHRLALPAGDFFGRLSRSPRRRRNPVEGSVDPTREQFEVFKDLPRDTPIQMLNLIRCREKAAYPDDHANAAAGLTGREAYGEYGRTSSSVFGRVGGRIVWSGRPEAVVIGGGDETWDIAFIAEYPNANAFLEIGHGPRLPRARQAPAGRRRGQSAHPNAARTGRRRVRRHRLSQRLHRCRGQRAVEPSLRPLTSAGSRRASTPERVAST
jgi:hypothetical protein